MCGRYSYSFVHMFTFRKVFRNLGQNPGNPDMYLFSQLPIWLFLLAKSSDSKKTDISKLCICGMKDEEKYWISNNIKNSNNKCNFTKTILFVHEQNGLETTFELFSKLPGWIFVSRKNLKSAILKIKAQKNHNYDQSSALWWHEWCHDGWDTIIQQAKMHLNEITVFFLI